LRGAFGRSATIHSPLGRSLREGRRAWNFLASDHVASVGEKRDGRSLRFVPLTARIFVWQFTVVVHALRTEGYMKMFVATIIAFLFACNSIVTCNAASITDLKAAIEGVYILEEWKIDGQTFRPPLVEGRFVVLNGNIMTVLIDTRQDTKKTYTTLYGVYSLTSDSFAYKYETRATFVQTPDNISLTRAPFWEGMREFTVKQEGNSVHLQFGDKAEMVYNPDGQTYSEAGKVVRVWHRAKSE
jgi:hypothetical protein